MCMRVRARVCVCVLCVRLCVMLCLPPPCVRFPCCVFPPVVRAGLYGTCCTEMDIWEANAISSAVTPHVCTVQGQYRCNGTECGDGSDRFNGVCDKDGKFEGGQGLGGSALVR